ncbi:MAG: SO2930 family diheme c-type cytochrome [Pseudomonadota bacterium]
MFDPDAYPQRLSEWQLFTKNAEGLALSPHNHVYDLNVALFSDYAHKLRTLYVPPGAALTYQDYESYDAPVGTIISKTFFYNVDSQGQVNLAVEFSGDPEQMGTHRLVETRLLIKQAHGWDALPYIWREDDAYLKITGDLLNIPILATDESHKSMREELHYLVPSKNQCASCHATNHTSAAIKPIGIKTRHLNKMHPVTGTNQLVAWVERGELTGLPPLKQLSANAALFNHADLNHAARSYLDINCGHCHNPQGAADTSGLLLDYAEHDKRDLGTCKPPIAAGRGSGGHLYSIVPGKSSESIMAFRLATTDPGMMMPELGRSLIHHEGLALVEKWIDAMTGECT